MGLFGALNALLTADNKSWKKGFSEARGEVDETSKKTRGFFSELKSLTGKGSALGQSLKLAAGGGAIGALTALSNQAKEFAVTLTSLNDKYAQGELSSRDYYRQLGEAIPIIGGFAASANTIIDAMTGVAAAQSKARRESAALAKELASDTARWKEWEKTRNSALQSFEDDVQEVRTKKWLAGFSDGADRAVAELQVDAGKKVSAARAKLADLDKRVQTANDRYARAQTAGQGTPLQKQEFNLAKSEYEALLRDKKRMVREEGQWEYEFNLELGQEINKVKADANKEAAEAQNKAAKEAMAKEVAGYRQTLESRKTELEEALKQNKTEDHYRIARSEAVRAAFTIQQPAINDAKLKAAQDILRELKEIKLKLGPRTAAAAPADGGSSDDDDSYYR